MFYATVKFVMRSTRYVISSLAARANNSARYELERVREFVFCCYNISRFFAASVLVNCI